MAHFGVHVNAQNKSLADLIKIFSFADERGFDWVSASDHFPGSLGPESVEAIALHTAMAMSTRRARCGMLVYSIGFRHPVVLASAAATIDQLSGGRASIGIGSGAAPKDYELYGLPFPALGVRSDMLEEAAECIARLLHDDVVEFKGTHFQITGASLRPKPIQDRLPVIVGTAGEQRGLRTVARHADGWNVSGQSPAAFGDKRKVLGRHCEAVGRDPREISCSVNVALGDDPAAVPKPMRDWTLTGPPEEMAGRIDAYVSAGADQVNIHVGLLERLGRTPPEPGEPYPWAFETLDAVAAVLQLPGAESQAN